MPTPRIHKVSNNKIHFLTFTTVEWIDIFTKPKYFDLILDTLRYCQKQKGLFLHGFVVMTNHIHSIMSAKDSYYLDDVVASFKKFTTIKIKELLKEDNRKYILSLIKNSFSKKQGTLFQVWQRENYPEIIETQKFFLQKLNYMHNNPVRKNYVVRPEDWLYSSARNYILNDDSLIKIDKLF